MKSASDMATWFGAGIMDNAKQMKAIVAFCSKPQKEHGKMRMDGEHDHDYAYLVRQIAFFDSGKTCDDATAKGIAKVLRKKSSFPNGPDWDEIVNAPGAHERMLEVIRAELALAKEAETPMRDRWPRALD
jgi:hypothetical protein